MSEDDQPPDKGKQEPGQDKGEGEDQQRPAPLCVHEGREDICHVSAPALGHVPLHYIAVSLLEDDPLPHPSCGVSG